MYAHYVTVSRASIGVPLFRHAVLEELVVQHVAKRTTCEVGSAQLVLH